MATLKDLRERAMLSQSELARACGVNRQTIYHWESGIWQPKAEHRRKLVEVLQCTREELFTALKEVQSQREKEDQMVDFPLGIGYTMGKPERRVQPGIKTLKRLRQEASLTQSALAAACDVSKQTIWEWEHAYARPGPQNLRKLAGILGKEVPDILDALDATAEETKEEAAA